mmetsp:Transcript_2692/g.4740  ORF Transcript_2692/g.4740 Transcript_2692/m.4740 type:complete len:322 (-) Transcript_2692:917-1882(-)
MVGLKSIDFTGVKTFRLGGFVVPLFGNNSTRLKQSQKTNLSRRKSVSTLIHRRSLVFHLLLFPVFIEKGFSTMAWRSHGTSNVELVDTLRRNKLLHSESVYHAMRATDRANYISFDSTFGSHSYAYQDTPQPIGYNATISAPHMHATCLELLVNHLHFDSNALDVGSGSGYLSACMLRMILESERNSDGSRDENRKGVVVGVEHIKGLNDKAIENVKRDGLESMLEKGRLRLLAKDGRLGYQECAPYSAIHVGAAAPKIPETLIEQLDRGGRMVIPVGEDGGYQELMQVDKGLDGKVTAKSVFGVRYVPLCEKSYQWTEKD